MLRELIFRTLEIRKLWPYLSFSKTLKAEAIIFRTDRKGNKSGKEFSTGIFSQELKRILNK